MSKSAKLFLAIREELLNTHNQVTEGELSNLDGLIEMRKAKAQAEAILEDVKRFEDDRLNEITNEAQSYNGKYCGFEIKSVAGRKLFSFKGIEEHENAKATVSEIEEKYKSAFDGFQKGTVQTDVDENGVRYWIDESGELKPFPEMNIGKSFLQVKEIKSK
jgi:hypothetical protein